MRLENYNLKSWCNWLIWNNQICFLLDKYKSWNKIWKQLNNLFFVLLANLICFQNKIFLWNSCSQNEFLINLELCNIGTLDLWNFGTLELLDLWNFWKRFLSQLSLAGLNEQSKFIVQFLKDFRKRSLFELQKLFLRVTTKIVSLGILFYLIKVKKKSYNFSKNKLRKCVFKTTNFVV